MESLCILSSYGKLGVLSLYGRFMYIEFIEFIWKVYALIIGSKFLAIRCVLS
jgi:hypothetical protein